MTFVTTHLEVKKARYTGLFQCDWTTQNGLYSSSHKYGLKCVEVNKKCQLRYKYLFLRYSETHSISGKREARLIEKVSNCSRIFSSYQSIQLLFCYVLYNEIFLENHIDYQARKE